MCTAGSPLFSSPSNEMFSHCLVQTQQRIDTESQRKPAPSYGCMCDTYTYAHYSVLSAVCNEVQHPVLFMSQFTQPKKPHDANIL